MADGKKQLSVFEAACIVAGLGVGGGIMGVPYLAASNGILNFVLILVTAYAVSLVLHLMVAEMVLRDGGHMQLVELFGRHLFTGRGGAVYTWAFFVLVVITFLALLAAYLVGCGAILHELLGLPVYAAQLLTYALAAGVVFYGLRVMGIVEKYAITVMGVVTAVLALGSLGSPFNALPALAGNLKTGLGLFGMAMFSFACFFSVPQAAEGLSWNRKLVARAVVLGISINFAFTFVIAFTAMLVSREVTQIAIIGWGRAVGNWAWITGSVFFFLAMLTTYWSVSYALAVVIRERMKWGDRPSWLAATLPTLAIALVNPATFLNYLQLAGGATAILVALLVVPTLRRVRRARAAADVDPALARWGAPVFQVIVVIAYLLMALGSIVAMP
jgi:amino acid permease